ncbi:hypothetical protein C8A03DRAFT_44668 [Achaetomium macrosporum]|uniref:Dystroglycan-type cadherin-like domain-containing protein n=1 Tax=Achaetomium macrosporum TaxID=79813 RepID=A0AAN7HDG5_9PEZI|nr:hypothetical protein C8A03DRAFT_44668 [Achaetomium macrosporum]
MTRQSTASSGSRETAFAATTAPPVVAWTVFLLLAAFSAAAPTISIGSPITYSLSNPPNWLSIDSNSRRLFGTPGEEDVAPGRVVDVPLDLVTTDNSRSTTLTATLVVSRSQGPKVGVPLDKQVPGFGTFSSPSAILSSPSQAFSFRLSPDTFSNTPGAPISYYATMADNTPLPAWVSFDPGSLSFTGRTPPSESLVQPPQHFAFRLVASDVPGSTVKVDGQPATAQTAVIASAPNLPSWLSIDKDTWHITGIPPDIAESTNFTVTIRDTYSDVLNLTVAVKATDDKAGLFMGSLSSPEDTDVSVEIDSSQSWIQFNPGTSTLFGDAPEGLRDSAVDVMIRAQSKSSKESVALSFSILIRAASDGKGSTPTSGPTTAGTHATDGHRSSGGDGSGNERFNPVLLAVLLPLLVLLSLATCALFWYFRRRKDNRKPALSTRDVSGPISGTFVARSADPGASRSLPDFTKRFGKSFSADDVWGIEKNDYFESRSTFMARPDVPQRFGAVRLLPPSGKVTKTPVTSSVTSGTLRPGTRGKVSSSLSSVTEASFGEIADSRGLESAGSDINVPRLPQTPGSAHTRTPSSAELVGTPRVGSSLKAPDTGDEPPRPESRFSYHPATAVGIIAKRQVSKLPSPGQPSGTPRLKNGNGASGLDLPSLPLPQSGLAATNLTTPGPSMPGGKENLAADRPNPYDGLVMPNPFGSSRTWSTLPTTDEWVDETVESLALSRSTTQQQQNWTALQGSPVINGRDATAPERLPELASSIRLPQVQTGLGESLVAVPIPAPLRPRTAIAESKGAEIPELLGLARKS